MKFKTISIIAILAIILCVIAASFVFLQKNSEYSDNSKDEFNNSKIIFGVINSIEVIDGQYRLLIWNNYGEYIVNVPESVGIKFPEFYDNSNISEGGLVEINYSGIMTKSIPPILTASSLLYYPPEFVNSGIVTEIDEVGEYKRFLVEGKNSLCYVTVTNDTLVSGNLNDISINSTVTYSSIIQLLSYPGQCTAIHFIIN